MPICTFDWLFVDPEAGKYFIGIAAHCTDEVGERVELDGHGEIGTVVYDSDLQPGADEGVDFTLIELDAGVNLIANPKMFEAEGPTGYVTCAEVDVGDRIQLHGYGMVFGWVGATRTRPGFIEMCDDRDYGALTTAIYGDSGGPVLHVETGKALGIVSRLGADKIPTSELAGAMLPAIFSELAKAGWHVRLATVDGSHVGP